MAPRGSKIEGLRIGLTDAGKLIGKSIQHVRNLVRDGFIPEPADGGYLASDVASGALRARDDEDRRSSKSAAASRIHDARAAEIEQRTAERKKLHMIEAQSEAVAVIDEFAGQLRSDIMAIPARVTADVVMRRRIEEQVDEAFGAAGKRAAAAAGRVAPPRSIVGKPAARNGRNVGAKQPGVSGQRRRAGTA